MKQNKTIIITFILLIITGALYRLIDNRPLGFAPQIAMAIFGGAVIRDKKWAFAVPLFSMLISDLLFEVMNRAGIVHNMPGFYEGQWVNYLLLSGITCLGFLIRKINVANVAIASLAAPVVYFLLSNFSVWISGGGYGRPFTGAGLYQCMLDGAPFFKGSLYATIAFSALLFGAYALVQRVTEQKMQKAVL